MSIIRIKWFKLFKEVVVFYSENRTKPMNALCEMGM
jgi:hypothetical protein